MMGGGGMRACETGDWVPARGRSAAASVTGGAWRVGSGGEVVQTCATAYLHPMVSATSSICMSAYSSWARV